MGIKTAAVVRPEIPLQKDGRTELQELAAALSQHVEQRHRHRGSHELEVVSEPELYDLTAEPELPSPPRAPEPRSTVVLRGARRVVPLVFAAVLTAAVSVAGWTAEHSSKPAATPTTHTTQPTTQTTQPTTPAEWGAAAHERLSAADRPVDVFGCQSAYAADATQAAGVLPPAATSPETWRAYLATCLSGMSDASVGHSA